MPIGEIIGRLQRQDRTLVEIQVDWVGDDSFDGGKRTLSLTKEQNTQLISALAENKVASPITAINLSQTLPTSDSKNETVVKSSLSIDLIQAFQKLPYLTELRLANSNITDIGARAIAQLIRESSTLAVIDLRGNAITDVGALLLAEAIEKTEAPIAMLLLGNNCISDIGASDLALAIQNNKTLVNVDLSKNKISKAGVDAIEQFSVDNFSLKENHALTCFDLSGNGALSLIVDGAREATSESQTETKSGSGLHSTLSSFNSVASSFLKSAAFIGTKVGSNLSVGYRDIMRHTKAACSTVANSSQIESKKETFQRRLLDQYPLKKILARNQDKRLQLFSSQEKERRVLTVLDKVFFNSISGPPSLLSVDDNANSVLHLAALASSDAWNRIAFLFGYSSSIHTFPPHRVKALAALRNAEGDTFLIILIRNGEREIVERLLRIWQEKSETGMLALFYLENHKKETPLSLMRRNSIFSEVVRSLSSGGDTRDLHKFSEDPGHRSQDGDIQEEEQKQRKKKNQIKQSPTSTSRNQNQQSPIPTQSSESSPEPSPPQSPEQSPVQSRELFSPLTLPSPLSSRPGCSGSTSAREGSLSLTSKGAPQTLISPSMPLDSGRDESSRGSDDSSRGSTGDSKSTDVNPFSLASQLWALGYSESFRRLSEERIDELTTTAVSGDERKSSGEEKEIGIAQIKQEKQEIIKQQEEKERQEAKKRRETKELLEMKNDVNRMVRSLSTSAPQPSLSTLSSNPLNNSAQSHAPAPSSPAHAKSFMSNRMHVSLLFFIVTALIFVLASRYEINFMWATLGAGVVAIFLQGLESFRRSSFLKEGNPGAAPPGFSLMGFDLLSPLGNNYGKQSTSASTNNIQPLQNKSPSIVSKG